LLGATDPHGIRLDGKNLGRGGLYGERLARGSSRRNCQLGTLRNKRLSDKPKGEVIFVWCFWMRKKSGLRKMLRKETEINARRC